MSMIETYKLNVDYRTDGESIDLSTHGFGQGGFDDMAFTPQVVTRMKALRPKVIRLFVQEYFSVMPSPGVYDWAKLDKAIEAIYACGSVPLLALCMKPPCLFPTPDVKALVPESWEAWESMIQAMITHFTIENGWCDIWYEVGNEPDIGGGAPYLYGEEDAELYADCYERTVKAIRLCDPKARVGGPALSRRR